MMSNKGASYAFRNEVLLYLTALGLDVTRPREIHRVSEYLVHPTYGDILGSHRWVLETHAAKGLDLSVNLDAARSEARRAGTKFYATINRRIGRAVPDAYATLPFSVLARLLLEERDRALQGSSSEPNP